MGTCLACCWLASLVTPCRLLYMLVAGEDGGLQTLLWQLGNSCAFVVEGSGSCGAMQCLLMLLKSCSRLNMAYMHQECEGYNASRAACARCSIRHACSHTANITTACLRDISSI